MSRSVILAVAALALLPISPARGHTIHQIGLDSADTPFDRVASAIPDSRLGIEPSGMTAALEGSGGVQEGQAGALFSLAADLETDKSGSGTARAELPGAWAESSGAEGMIFGLSAQPDSSISDIAWDFPAEPDATPTPASEPTAGWWLALGAMALTCCRRPTSPCP